MHFAGCLGTARESHRRLFNREKRIIEDCLTVPCLAMWKLNTLWPANVAASRHLPLLPTYNDKTAEKGAFDRAQKTMACLSLCVLHWNIIILFQIISVEALQRAPQIKQWKQVCSFCWQQGNDIFHSKRITAAKSRRRVFSFPSFSLPCTDSHSQLAHIFRTVRGFNALGLRSCCQAQLLLEPAQSCRCSEQPQAHEKLRYSRRGKFPGYFFSNVCFGE